MPATEAGNYKSVKCLSSTSKQRRQLSGERSIELHSLRGYALDLGDGFSDARVIPSQRRTQRPAGSRMYSTRSNTQRFRRPVLQCRTSNYVWCLTSHSCQLIRECKFFWAFHACGV
ncbi:hypothetical protein CY34DRAFT_687599 [Suillus luteus UH-Slu-Lm8-n1]|uniref:Uncharacterized protein n=1 Tax=Suillus luteus UH-Slu-Lm8-n1 TaxID=930992 RepID=A0A0D0A185_9AGAM|nr:hypothetical protein CY34DRAFT_687599 [Suillus luteus UH-Slu-Lm8-n1]